MSDVTALSAGQAWAILLAAAGAVLFGLAAVRQHRAVQESVSSERKSLRQHLQALVRLVRQPSWLVGAVQGTVAGGLHIGALALAPIILVQPIGVLAVPVTVIATAVREHRRPGRSQVLGSSLSVVGIAVMTVFLLAPSAGTLTLPGWWVLAATTAVLVAAGAITTLTGARGRPLVRCVCLAVTAAVLFGLNSILIRTIEHLLATGASVPQAGLLVAAVLGIALALPVGLWAMQTAYLSGSPHVVICCLTLMDPLTAMVGGRLLLHDGDTISGLTLLAVIICALVAAAGVVVLSAQYPSEHQAPELEADLAVPGTPSPVPQAGEESAWS